jgi:hypothetical protein
VVSASPDANRVFVTWLLGDYRGLMAEAGLLLAGRPVECLAPIDLLSPLDRAYLSGLCHARADAEISERDFSARMRSVFERYLETLRAAAPHWPLTPRELERCEAAYEAACNYAGEGAHEPSPLDLVRSLVTV